MSIRFSASSRTFSVSAFDRRSSSPFLSGFFAMSHTLADTTEMNRSLGQALAVWQHVETSLYVLAHCLIGTDHKTSSILFFHIESARAKVSLTNKLCELSLEQSAYQRHWIPIKKDLNAAVDIRNALAHFEISAIDPRQTRRKDGSQSKCPLILSSNAHDEGSVRDGTVKCLFVEDLHETTTWYKKLSREILILVANHVPDWQQRSATLPQNTRRLIAIIQSEPAP